MLLTNYFFSSVDEFFFIKYRLQIYRKDMYNKILKIIKKSTINKYILEK